MSERGEPSTTAIPSSYSFRQIGIISTPFKQKFGIPRQSQALSKAKGIIKFAADINPVNACRGLDAFSHLWISFIFHANINNTWKDTVRPPRLGGNQKIGVFASRSTFRPNPIGLSVVKNLKLNEHNELIVEGVDLLNQTPIIDIKPYISYADSIADAHCGFAEQAPLINMPIDYSVEALKTLASAQKHYPEFAMLLENMLSQDPRPAYKNKLQDDKIYSICLYNFEVKWRVKESYNFVIEIRELYPA